MTTASDIPLASTLEAYATKTSKRNSTQILAALTASLDLETEKMLALNQSLIAAEVYSER